MAISIVQQNGASSTALNPTLRLNGVTAGTMLIVAVLQAANETPGQATDSRGDVLDPIGSATLLTNPLTGAGLGLQLWRVRSAIGGNTTVNFLTAAASACAALEVSGVQPDLNIGLPNETVQPGVEAELRAASALTVSITPQTASDVLLGIVAVLGNPAFTIQSVGWTLVRSQNSAAASLSIATNTPGSAAPQTLQYGVTPAMGAALFVLSLTPA